MAKKAKERKPKKDREAESGAEIEQKNPDVQAETEEPAGSGDGRPRIPPAQRAG
jgi:hypothetical protein